IATNLLADRLREMEAAGVVTSKASPPPTPATLFALTERGRALEPIVMQLGSWGAPLLAQAPKSDSFQLHWLVLPARLHLTDHDPERPPVCIELRSQGEAVTVEASGGGVQVHPGAAPGFPALVLDGPRQAILGLLLGKLDWAAARRAGLTHSGDPKVLRRVQPRAG